MLKQILVAAGLVAAVSAAAESRFGPGAMLEGADTNSDGMVVRDEFLAARAGVFTRMDRNSDGFVDKADWPEGRPEGGHSDRAAKMHERMDADSDGKISKDEFVNSATPMFDRLDADHNSVLDAKEIEAAKERGRKMRKHGPDHGDAQP
jgi:Ca2+-binding EF-hand superfamily protein